MNEEMINLLVYFCSKLGGTQQHRRQIIYALFQDVDSLYDIWVYYPEYLTSDLIAEMKRAFLLYAQQLGSGKRIYARYVGAMLRSIKKKHKKPRRPNKG